MSVTSTVFAGINVFQFSGAVTDAEIKTAWAGTISEGRYVLNRAIYLDDTADLRGVTGGFFVDFGTQVLPAFIIHTNIDRTKQTFNNFTFLQRTGLSVANRALMIRGTNGTTLTDIGNNGLAQNGGGFIYGVFGVAPGGGDNRYLNELPFDDISNATIYSQEFAEQELQVISFNSKPMKGVVFEKAYGFPQIGTPTASVSKTVYRSNMNTQATASNGLIPIRLFPSGNRFASVCYVDSYVTRNSADITVNLIATFGTNASNLANITILNNFERGSWFGTTKTSFTASNWFAGNTIHGGVLKKLQFIGGSGGWIESYDSRSTTTPQKCAFEETGFIDFLNPSTTPPVNANGEISVMHIGAIATGGSSASIPITRITNQRRMFKQFGSRILVVTPDMTSGDNDLSAFAPVILTQQEGISRTQAAINSATSIDTFQELLEELHVLALGIKGEQSYNGAYDGNLFTYDGAVLTTSFATVNVDATAASKIAYNATTNTLTIKSSVLTSNSTVQRWNNTTGTINVLNGANIQAVYQDSAGTSTQVNFNNIVAGSSLVVYKLSDSSTQYFQQEVTTGGTFSYFIAPQTSGSTFKWAIERYGYKRQEGSFPNNIGGTVNLDSIYVDDVGIIQTNKSTVQAYTAIENPDKLYDRTALFRLTEVGIKLGQIATKDGSAVNLAGYSMIVKATATSVYNITGGNTIIIKSGSYVNGTVYNNTITNIPNTITADTTEIITANIEDANGDSSFTILGGSGSFTLWRLANSAFDNDYATGTFISNATNEKIRFLSESGFKIVVHDLNSNVNNNSTKDKGNYDVGMYYGDQIQLAQSAQVLQINDKVEIMQADLININKNVKDGSLEIPADLNVTGE